MQKLLILLLLACAPLTTWADAYTIQMEETIENPGDSAGSLREKTLNKLVEEGFSQLLRKLTPSSVWSRHAWLMSEVNPDVALEKVSIVEETSQPTLYKLKVDLTFKRELLRKLLARHGIPFSETDTATVLLIPLYEVGDAQILWEETNPWRDALRSQLLRDGLLTFTLPAGDMTEMSLLSPQMASGGAADALLQLAASYQSAAVVVARAKIQQRGAQSNLRLEATWFRQGEEALPAVTLNMPVPMRGVNEEVLGQAAQKLFAALENTWRQSGMVAADKPASLYLRVPAHSIEELARFEHHLNGLSAVFNVMPKLLSQTESVYEVSYFGNLQSLQEQLAGLGYRMSREGNLWRIHMARNPS